VTDDLDGGASQHVVFVVGQRLGRSNDDGITCVYTKRVKILHIAANDGVLNKICSMTGNGNMRC